MELRELRSFCTAARLKSISRAAEALEIGQPTVTTHIKKLEGELGVQLFDRIKRPIQLTPVGAALAQLAAPLVDGIDSLAAHAGVIEQEAPVHIAATHEMIPHTLVQAVRVFLKTHPHVHLRINAGRREDIMHMVEEGEADLGFVPSPERGSDFEFLPLLPYERVLITPPDHPLLAESMLTLEEIAKYPLIMMAKGTWTRRIVEAEFRRRGLSYEIIVELDSMDIIKRYVALGMGVSIGPSIAVEMQDSEDLGVVRLSHLLPVEQAGIIWLQGKTLSRHAEEFVGVVKDTLSVANRR
ncbi:MAG: LysR substrate-binding domain-containing protein [Chloroflexi bacterium]|nr:LysR substrate-binding domain-containing protein [Chloroflexota bacterium]